MFIMFIFLLCLLLAVVMAPSLTDKIVEKIPTAILMLSSKMVLIVFITGGMIASGAVFAKVILNGKAIDIQQHCCSTAKGEYSILNEECSYKAQPDDKEHSKEKFESMFPTCIERVTSLKTCCDTAEGGFSYLSEECVTMKEVEVEVQVKEPIDGNEDSSGKSTEKSAKTDASATPQTKLVTRTVKKNVLDEPRKKQYSECAGLEYVEPETKSTKAVATPTPVKKNDASKEDGAKPSDSNQKSE